MQRFSSQPDHFPRVVHAPVPGTGICIAAVHGKSFETASPGTQFLVHKNRSGLYNVRRKRCGTDSRSGGIHQREIFLRFLDAAMHACSLKAAWRRDPTLDLNDVVDAHAGPYCNRCRSG